MDLEQILQGAPFGLEVRTSDGTDVFANQQARRLASGMDNSNLYRTANFQIAAEGEQFAVSLSVDAGDQLKLENELFERAYFDEMTRLPNRSLIRTET